MLTHLFSLNLPRNNFLRPLFWVLFCLAGCSAPSESPFPREVSLPTDSVTWHFKLVSRDSALSVLSTRSDPPLREYRDFRIPFPVYQMQFGDLNRNRAPDLLLGVEKATPFDPVLRRRLFIYELRGNRFQKLWEGSRLVHPLADFRIVQDHDPPLVHSMEYEKNGLYLVGRYRLANFGLELIDYLARDLDSLEAAKMLTP
jgi:hypothetical protein